jgi:streptomycin 6-kinase
MVFARVPDAVRGNAIVLDAEAWLAALPSLVAELEHEWGMTVGRAYSGGTEAFVAEVALEDQSPAVLKLRIPRGDDSAKNEIIFLRLAAGGACARLLQADVARGAMLLERLGAPLYARGLPAMRRHEILCSTAERLWRPAPGCGLPTGAERGRWLVQFITSKWEDLARPCSEQAVEYALACAERRIAAHDDARAVLVHGDIHQLNALEADGGYKLIDPDGLLAEAEYDLGVLMRGDPLELIEGDPHQRSCWLAHRTGLDETAIWEWGVVERVSSGLVCTSIDLQPLARDTLEAAEFAARYASSN